MGLYYYKFLLLFATFDNQDISVISDSLVFYFWWKLTYWGQNKMVAIMQTLFLQVFF